MSSQYLIEVSLAFEAYSPCLSPNLTAPPVTTLCPSKQAFVGV